MCRAESVWLPSASGWRARSLSASSAQPFRSIVIVVDAGHVTMEGQFAAGFSGRWTGECTLTDPSAKMRRREPPSATNTVAPIEPITAQRPWEPLARPGVLLDFLDRAPRREVDECVDRARLSR
jgi:hypothetical protein